MTSERVVAVGLLTQANLDMLGDSLRKVYPVEDSPCFSDLLRAIDEADREQWREQDRVEALRQMRRKET